MVATATKPKTFTFFTRGRGAQCDGLPMEPGALVEFRGHHQRLVQAGLAYVAELPEGVEPLACEHPGHRGLYFVHQDDVKRHDETWNKRIADLRVAIPRLETSAQRSDLAAEDLQPMNYMPSSELRREKQRIADSAQSARDDAAKFRRELEALTGEQE